MPGESVSGGMPGSGTRPDGDAPPAGRSPGDAPPAGRSPGDAPPDGGNRGGAPPANGNAGDPPPAGAAAPGLRHQLGATRAAAVGLVRAHIDLAQAEFSEILDEVKRVSIAIGIAIALVLFATVLIPIGTALFVGEWLFGSIGWGVLLGTETAFAVAAVVAAGVVGLPRARIVTAFIVALVVGLVVGLVFGLDMTNQGWSRLGESAVPNVDPSVRPLALAAGSLAAILGLLGLILGAIGGGFRGAVGGLIIGVFAGFILGAFTAVRWGVNAGAGAGVAIGLIVWPGLVGAALARDGIDVDALKSRFWPSQTIDTTRETIEWVREQTPLGRKS